MALALRQLNPSIKRDHKVFLKFILMDSFVLVAYGSFAASRTFLQQLPGCLNFILDSKDLLCGNWCIMGGCGTAQISRFKNAPGGLHFVILGQSNSRPGTISSLLLEKHSSRTPLFHFDNLGGFKSINIFLLQSIFSMLLEDSTLSFWQLRGTVKFKACFKNAPRGLHFVILTT